MASHNESRDGADIDERGLRPAAAYSIRDAGERLLRLEGELDLAAAPELRRRFDTVGSAVVVDLEHVTFIDSAVLKELLRARAELAERGARLVLAGVPAPVRRLLDLTRTTELFEHAPDVDEALKRLSD
jgi:stage II sporulation protein AA (anti-sigma F factor antagonist)